jgi:hypothetical protein
MCHTALKRSSRAVILGEGVMKKSLVSILAVAMLSLMVGGVFAQVNWIPTPEFCICYPEGLTPGFWKHNLEVYLGETNGKYSAIYGDKLNDAQMETLLGMIRDTFGLDSSYDLEQLAGELLEILKEPGWSMDRTNVANWFNFWSYIGPYVPD